MLGKFLIAVLLSAVYAKPVVQHSEDTDQIKERQLLCDICKSMNAGFELLLRRVSSLEKAARGLTISNSASSLKFPEDCGEILSQDSSAGSGVYQINIGSDRVPKIVNAFCDMETDGGGWTIFQRRIDGSINFYRNWKSYADGFGFLWHEHWLGNDILHYMTSKENNELRIDLKPFTGESRYAHYTTFRVSSACDKYRMHVDGYSGTAGDSFHDHHNGMRFSTYDRVYDNDKANCAVNRHGAWWYNGCTKSNLNGQWIAGPGAGSRKNIVWYSWLGPERSLEATTMMIRPALLTCPV